MIKSLKEITDPSPDRIESINPPDNGKIKTIEVTFDLSDNTDKVVKSNLYGSHSTMTFVDEFIDELLTYDDE